MSGSMEYITVASSLEVLTALYENNPVERYFECPILVQAPRLDGAEESALTLYVSRIYDAGHSYQHANGDRVYRTVAQLEPNGKPFDIDVIIRSREASLVGATISISDEVTRIIAES